MANIRYIDLTELSVGKLKKKLITFDYFVSAPFHMYTLLIS